MNLKRTLKQRVSVLLGAVVYILALNWAYVHIVSPRFDYMGFHCRPLELTVLLPAWMMAITPSVWMPIEVRRPSQLVYWILYLTVVAPGVAIAPYTLKSEPDHCLWFGLIQLLAFALLAVVFRLPRLRLSKPRVPNAYWLAVAMLFLVVSGFLALKFGVRTKLATLDEVYDVRAAFEAESPDAGTLSGYAVDWQKNVTAPLLFARGVLTANPLFGILGMVGFLQVYSLIAMKVVFMYMALIIVLVPFFRLRPDRRGPYLLWGTVAAVLVGLGIDSATGQYSIWTEMTANRGLLVPGLITMFYFEFFSEHPVYYLSDSFLRFFLEKPYPLSSPELIGWHYMDTPGVYANGSIWADAFANCGYGGVFGYTILLAGLLWLADLLAQGRDPRLVMVVFAIQAVNLSSSSLFTTLLSHGLGLTLLLVYLLPTEAGATVRHRRRSVARSPAAGMGRVGSVSR